MDFFADLYEFWGYFLLGNFSNDMYQNGIYSHVGISMLVTTLVLMAVFYYVINHPRWAKISIWALYLTGVAFINYVIAHVIVYTRFNSIYGNNIPDYTSDMITFSFENAIIAMIAGALFSIFLKLGSSVLNKIPF